MCVVSNSLITLSKVYTRGSSDKEDKLQSFLDVLPKQTNIMSVKGFRRSEKCAARCVHLSPKKNYTSPFLEDSKIHASGGIANSQRMLTKIRESGVNTLGTVYMTIINKLQTSW